MEEENKFNRGTPSMVLMPARNYVFKISNDNYVISIPRKGKYCDLAPELFSSEDGEFNIFNEENNIFYTPSITKVLFASGKYPDLNYNQFFSPFVIEFKEDEVIIIGQVIDMLLLKKEEDNEEKNE